MLFIVPWLVYWEVSHEATWFNICAAFVLARYDLEIAQFEEKEQTMRQALQIDLPILLLLHWADVIDVPKWFGEGCPDEGGGWRG